MIETESKLQLAAQFKTRVIDPLKKQFIGKDEVIELLGISLVARENLFILGPPGTAKSALVQSMARLIDGKVFDYLLTRFTEPNEIFGPFDIRRLREGDLVTNTDGMLPEAAFVFLDELLNANSAILNSLLMVLNERIFRRGKETLSLPTLMVVGASNSLPQEDALRALFDRFLLRVNCTNVESDQLRNVLQAGWLLESQSQREASVTVEDVRCIQQLVVEVNFDSVLDEYVDLVNRLRNAGIEISDRRAVKLQRVIAASAIMCGRVEAHASDLWVLQYIWDSIEQEEILSAIVQKSLDIDGIDEQSRHPMSALESEVNPESLARDLELLSNQISEQITDSVALNQTRDRLTALSGRVEWVRDEQKRTQLMEMISEAWDKMKS